MRGTFRRALLLFILGTFAAPGARAFDVIDRKLSYAENKYLSLGVGLGWIDFLQEDGVQGKPGFSFRVDAGHHFNQYLYGEFAYQWGTLGITSPDPIAPTAALSTQAEMHQETIRLLLTYPAVLVQPYVGAGFGGYQFTGLNQETALSLPADWIFPFSAGLRMYAHSNRISVDLDFTYNLLLGENQSADTLTLLALPHVSFDTYSFTSSFNFHFF